MRILGVIIGIVVVLGYIFVNHSVVVMNYHCNGALKEASGDVENERAFLEIGEYRAWVGLWSESNGYMKMQLDSMNFYQYWENIEVIGDGYIRSYEIRSHNDPVSIGTMRLPNGNLNIDVTEDVNFSGNCSED